MKHSADAHCNGDSYNAGDWVYVHLRLYHQTSLSPTYAKLSKRYFGSFPKFIVFHVSLLKLHQGTPSDSLEPLPSLSSNNNLMVEPITILDWK